VETFSLLATKNDSLDSGRSKYHREGILISFSREIARRRGGAVLSCGQSIYV
jgi:hypothetical protein